MEGALAHHYYVTGENQSSDSKTRTGVNESRAKYIGLFATQAVRHPTHHKHRWILRISSFNSPGAVGSQRKPPDAPTTPEGVAGLHLHNDGTSTSQRRDTTLHGQHKLDKEPLPLVLSYPIISASMLPSQERRDTGRLACP
jgi:hypothetical protein